MSIKAFNLVPALNKSNCESFKMSSIEICGKNLYIGTLDCEIVHFIMEESFSNNRMSFKSHLQVTKNIGFKKPIQQIKAASTINRIVILSGSSLLLFNMLNLEMIQVTTRIKFITSFAFNSSPNKPNPFNIEICATTSKKSIILLIMKEETIVQVKEISLHENPITLRISEAMVCVGFSDEYVMVDLERSSQQQLLIIKDVKPIIVPISKNEYLLSASNALGIICSAEGVSQRPPIQLQNDIIAISYCHPYIVTLSSDIISVYSILDQQPKQVLTFAGGVDLEKFNDRIFIRTKTDIYVLATVPIELQIQNLLDEKRVEEALLLSNNVKHEYLHSDNFKRIYTRVQQQAAFFQLKSLNFDQTHFLFIQSKLDPRELILLFPGYMPTTHAYEATNPPLHDFKNVQDMVAKDANKIQRIKRFFFEYLSEIDVKEVSDDVAQCIETALIKLHCDYSSHDQLIAYLTSCRLYSYQDCSEYLRGSGRYHGAALMASFKGLHDVALETWIQILNGDLMDNNFPGLSFIVDYMSNLSNLELIWKHADWMFEKDENLAIKVFTNREETCIIDPNNVLKFIAKYSKSTQISYLEYLIFRLSLEKESYHTTFAQLFLDKIIETSTEGDIHLRHKFRNFLFSSNHYQIQHVLHKIQDNDKLLYETAILQGKLENHETALQIFATKLKDFKAAEAYCLDSLPSLTNHKEGRFRSSNSGAALLIPSNSKKGFFATTNSSKGFIPAADSKDVSDLSSSTDAAAVRKKNSGELGKGNVVERNARDGKSSRLLFMLLSIYLGETEVYFEPAMELLSTNQTYIDSLEAVKLLPPSWSLNLLRLFLIGSLRIRIDQSRCTKIQKALATRANISTKSKLNDRLQSKIHLSEDSLCSICKQQFVDSSFAYLPNRSVVHIKCSRAYSNR